MDTEKKVYETPEITKVEFDAGDRITASYCFETLTDAALPVCWLFE